LPWPKCDNGYQFGCTPPVFGIAREYRSSDFARKKWKNIANTGIAGSISAAVSKNM